MRDHPFLDLEHESPARDDRVTESTGTANVFETVRLNRAVNVPRRQERSLERVEHEPDNTHPPSFRCYPLGFPQRRTRSSSSDS